MGSTPPSVRFPKFFFQGIFSPIYTSCVNFMKIAALLRVGSIQVKNIGLWGVPLPPVRFKKLFVQDIISSIHTSCVNFIKIAPLLRADFIQVKNIGLWGVPLPPVRFKKFFVQDIFSSIHTSYVNFGSVSAAGKTVLPSKKIFCLEYFLVHTHILCEFR